MAKDERPRVAQTDADLRMQLEEHVRFIQRSAREYDAGDRAEAKRLALHIRTLVHDAAKSQSLLSQLGLKTRPFLDSAAERPTGIISSYGGIVGIRVQPEPAEYVPSFDAYPSRPVSFQQWWEGVVIADLRRREIRRRDLILTMANQDGGAHVDPTLDEVYAALSRENSMGMERRLAGLAVQPVPGVQFAAVRQIAHELLGTLGHEQPSIQIPVVVHNPTMSLHAAYRGIFKVDVGRNDPCPCGSGRKYKRCHGES